MNRRVCTRPGELEPELSSPVCYTLNLMKPGIDEVWKRLREHEGEVFRQVRGKEFTYTLGRDHVEPSTTDWRFPRKQVEEAVGLMPVDSTKPLQHLYAILMDPRIRRNDG